MQSHKVLNLIVLAKSRPSPLVFRSQGSRQVRDDAPHRQQHLHRHPDVGQGNRERNRNGQTAQRNGPRRLGGLQQHQNHLGHRETELSLPLPLHHRILNHLCRRAVQHVVTRWQRTHLYRGGGKQVIDFRSK